MTATQRPASTRVPTTTILAITAAAGLIPLNSSMIAVALPAIIDDFEVSTAMASTLITVYLAIMLVGQPVAGRLTDRIGSRRMVQGALLGLALMSALAALATTFWLLVVARSLQAICAAGLNPATQSLLRRITPPDQQGRVFGVLGSVLGIGAASGPVVGGVLVEFFGWAAIFVVNVPIALAAALATRRVASDSEVRDERHDGAAAPSGRIRNRVFVAGFSAQALSTAGQYALLILTPIILDAQGWNPGRTGLALSALTFGMIVMGPFGGRIGDVRGRRLPSMTGLTLATVAIATLALAGSSVDPILLMIALAAFGIGLGATTPNLMTAALGSVSVDRAGAAAGIFGMSRYVGSIGISLVIAALVSDGASGTATVLSIATICVALSIASATRLPAARR